LFNARRDGECLADCPSVCCMCVHGADARVLWQASSKFGAMKEKEWTITSGTVSRMHAFDKDERIEGEESLRITDETHEALREEFAVELGVGVRRLCLIPFSRHAMIPKGEQYLFVGLNTLPSIVRTASIDQCVWYMQKKNTCLMCFRFADGERFFSVHTSPVQLEIKIVDNSAMGVGVIIGSKRRTETIEFELNLCLIDRYTCFCCGRSDFRMKACKRCKENYCTITRYCDKHCQKADWRYHKAMCGK